MNISEIREKYPQYNDLSDNQLAEGLHKKFYSDIPIDQFLQKIGMSSPVEDVRLTNNELPQNNIQSDEPPVKQLSEIGAAPELNSLSMSAFKTSLGLLTTGDTESLKGIFKQNFGDDVNFTQTDDGRPVVNLPSGSYELNKEGLSAQDIVRATFQGLSFFPAGKAATIPSAIAKNAATQTALDATEGSLGGEGVNAKETLIAGALGGGLKGAENAIGSVYRGIKGNINAEAQAVINSGKEAGVKVLTSDVIPPSNFVTKNLQQTAEKIPLIGTGAVRETQENARNEAVNNIIDKYAIPSYEVVVKSLRAKKDRIKSAAGSTLSSTAKKVDELGEVSVDSTRNAISRVQQELSKKGVIPSDDAAQQLSVLSDAIESGAQTFTTLKENRTAFNEIIKGLDKAEKSQMSSRAKSLLTGVSKAITNDMEVAAKRVLSSRELAQWRRANAVYAQEARELTKSKFKNILDKGDLTPEAVKGMLFSKNKSEVAMLYKGLTNEGRGHARNAIINNVVESLSKRAGGITPNSFSTEMKKQGLQIDTFFKGKEKLQLKGLLKVLDHTRRAGDAAVTTPTGQSLYALIGIGTGAIAPKETLAAAATVATAARAYESPLIRNALLKIGSLPKGSTRFEAAVHEMQVALNSTFQSNTSDTQ